MQRTSLIYLPKSICIAANYTVENLEKPAVMTFSPDKGGKDTVGAYWDFDAEGESVQKLL